LRHQGWERFVDLYRIGKNRSHRVRARRLTPS
jgi:hypothetical protein